MFVEKNDRSVLLTEIAAMVSECTLFDEPYRRELLAVLPTLEEKALEDIGQNIKETERHIRTLEEERKKRERELYDQFVADMEKMKRTATREILHLAERKQDRRDVEEEARLLNEIYFL